MANIHELYSIYDENACKNLDRLERLRVELQNVSPSEINSIWDAKQYIALVNRFRSASARADKLKGENYPDLLQSLLSVGEDGLYSNNLRFIFELIQNVDDCDYQNPEDCKLDMRFDFNSGEIILTYNEVGFSPFNVFAITGIAEAAKNISASKTEIGEKGIGFKSVFGVADKVLIRSGWFSFALYKENFTIPIEAYQSEEYRSGTEMTLYVGDKAQTIYRQIKEQYCRKEALFGRNPLLFLNKLTSLKLYYDTWRSMEFRVSRTVSHEKGVINREDNVIISVNLRDHDNGFDRETVETITCARYTLPVTYDHAACRSRYGESTKVGTNGGKKMYLQAVVPYVGDVKKVGAGGLYSFLPTQLAFTVPIVCHAPFKLDASREFVDPQGKGDGKGNLWFSETARHLGELIKYVYMDWRSIARQEIVFYLPPANESIFARNNGKEKCLSSYDAFKGHSILELPLFITPDGSFKPYEEVFYFDPAENVQEPEKACRLLSPRRSLFLAPADISVGRFGIAVERDINNRLFRKALLSEATAEEALDYLDSDGYEYSERQFPKDENIAFSEAQIRCFMKRKDLSDLILKMANEAVKSKRRPFFSLTGTNAKQIKEVLPEDFEISDAPDRAEDYIRYCNGCCFCMDIPEESYLPCKNGIILSRNNPLTSFASFCYNIDSSDTFAIRIRLKEASSQLNDYVESNTGSAADFLRILANIRKTVRESIGKASYKKYLELIMRSGSDKNRYIQELLQNADDCDYPEDCLPSFTLHQRKGSIVTEYNELGFSRANIRSITAIGESTKDRLIKGEVETIGKKGVGFKTIFATASEVKIYSGEYNFSLSADAPTIPMAIRAPEHPVIGTRMEITLKNPVVSPGYKEQDILELCLCLRRLKRLEINGVQVSIEDGDDSRTITIGKRTYIYRKYVYKFEVQNAEALRELENVARAVSPFQQITCFVPEKRSALPDYPVYVGLPTRHRLRIPMAIDAPFELTTSREEIEVDFSSWNGTIRKEMYNAIIQVIHARKAEDRANILRFIRAGHRRVGLQDIYVNELSDSQYINEYPVLERLRQEQIMPTFSPKSFIAVLDKDALLLPEAVAFLLRALPPSNFTGIRPERIIDAEVPGITKEQKEKNDAVMNALNCKTADFSVAFPLLREFAEDSISDESFHEKLYAYLQDTPDSYQEALSELRIIPVYGVKGGVQFISWVEDGIFVKKSARTSSENYWVLNETILPKAMCEKMLGVNINEMTEEWEKNKYNSNLRSIVRGSNLEGIYTYLVREHKLGNLIKNSSFETLYAIREAIPLKNQLGEIVDTELYHCDQPEGYFPVRMLQRLIVHKECEQLAMFLKCRELKDIHYEDVDYYETLTDDDVEMLDDDYFRNSTEILRGFYLGGYLSDELLQRHDLIHIAYGRVNENYGTYSFPESPVENMVKLKAHIKTQWQNPISIVPEIVQRTVYKGKAKNGKTFELRSSDTREGALYMYSPEEGYGLCFCQMCGSLKPHSFIEVNNLELKPRYYFPQMRIALCLECSKRFEALRNNHVIRERYLQTIKNTKIENKGKLEIQLESDMKLTFTGKHLAEIQELLKLLPEESL